MIQKSFSEDTTKRPWQEVVDLKHKAQDSAIEQYLGGNTVVAEESTDSLVTTLTEIEAIPAKILAREVTAEEVTIAHINLTVRAHQKTNCLTEVLFAEAIRDAQRLDEHFKATGKLVGPFHGVPITLKDQFNVKGYDTTLGYVGRAFRPAEEDAYIVTVLRKAGAIVLAKTNVSTILCEPDNYLAAS